MKQIYRVHKRGDLSVGPYASIKNQRWLQYCEEPPCGFHHPTFWDEPAMEEQAKKAGLYNDDDPKKKFAFVDLYFGFNSIESIKAWFSENDWLLCLWDNDMIISILEVPEDNLFEGKHQVCFKLKDKRINEVDYKEIVDICSNAEIEAMKNIKQRLLLKGQLRTLD